MYYVSYIKTVKLIINSVNFSSFYYDIHYRLCTAPSARNHHTIAHFNPGLECEIHLSIRKNQSESTCYVHLNV